MALFRINSQPADHRVRDAAPDNWVDRWAPKPWRPYLRLMRADRPIGTWLLLIPCLWGAALALSEQGASAQRIGMLITHAALFTVGAFVMRGAGCAYNDIVDRDIDARVARTALRPIPAGDISLRRAWAFLGLLCLTGLTVLLQFNRFTILLGVGSLLLVGAYPFMKRITWWPQAWLGLTFNWGALVGYAAAEGRLSLSAFLLYAAGVTWTLGYDTIYAHQDKDDDALIGVKSSARALGARTRPALIAFYGATIILTGISILAGPADNLWTFGLLAAAAHFLWQIKTLDIDNSAACLDLFKSNQHAGLLILAPLLLAAVPWGAYIG